MKLTRPARGAAVAVLLALFAAAPAAADQPTRIVIDSGPVIRHLTAGTFCDFPVTSFRPMGSRLTIWDFSDGREAFTGNVVRRTITNDATGATFVAPTNAHEVDRFDSNLIRGVVSGQFLYEFLPGDVGPDGVIVNHLLETFVHGRATYVIDSNTNATLAISLNGTYTDICAALS